MQPFWPCAQNSGACDSVLTFIILTPSSLRHVLAKKEQPGQKHRVSQPPLPLQHHWLIPFLDPHKEVEGQGYAVTELHHQPINACYLTRRISSFRTQKAQFWDIMKIIHHTTDLYIQSIIFPVVFVAASQLMMREREGFCPAQNTHSDILFAVCWCQTWRTGAHKRKIPSPPVTLAAKYFLEVATELDIYKWP